MKFKTTPYHSDLLKDHDRLAIFLQAINDYNAENEVAYDLGCGSGILSYFLADKFNEIIALEIDKKAYNCAKENLKDFNNIEVVNRDVLNYNFSKKADLIVCEMLDTALIDEEQVPVLNYAKNFLKDTGKFIPEGVINSAQLVSMQREHIHWDEGAKYEEISDEVIYSEICFSDELNPDFTTNLKFKVTEDALLNGLKITTYTILSKNLIAGPLPMLNPPLLIPLNEKQVKRNNFINVKLKYTMGEGIESIQLEYD